MKGKFKGKILNLRNIIVSLIIVVIAAVSGISIVQYNSRNVQTNLGEAITTIAPNDINIEILKQAISEYNDEKTYSNGCSEFVDTVLQNAGILSSGKPNSQVWYNDYKAININSNYKIIEVARNNNFNSDDWTDAFNGVGLMPGDIICGRTSGDTGGHMAIYLGNAESYTKLNQYMNDYGVGTFSNRNIGGTVKGNWLVYATWEGGTSKINAYSNLFKSGTTVKCSKLVVYRFEKAEPNPTTYSLRLRKNGGSLSATFDVTYNNITKSTTTAANGSYTKVTTIGNNGDVEVNKNNYGNEDIYTIKESSQPVGYNNDHSVCVK